MSEKQKKLAATALQFLKSAFRRDRDALKQIRHVSDYQVILRREKAELKKECEVKDATIAAQAEDLATLRDQMEKLQFKHDRMESRMHQAVVNETKSIERADRLQNALDRQFEAVDNATPGINRALRLIMKMMPNPPKPSQHFSFGWTLSDVDTTDSDPATEDREGMVLFNVSQFNTTNAHDLSAVAKFLLTIPRVGIGVVLVSPNEIGDVERETARKLFKWANRWDALNYFRKVHARQESYISGKGKAIW